MNPILLYTGKAALCITVFYLFFLFFLGRDTMYARNRIFILLSFISALILPFVIIRTQNPLDIQFFGKDLTGATIYSTTASASASGNLLSWDWKQSLLIIYLSGVFLLGLKLVAEIISLLLLIRKQKRYDTNIISLKNRNTSGFSAFGHVFIDSGLNPNDAKEIVRHEQKHLNQYHFIDILFVEIMKVLQWFNPFIYLYDRSLRAVHEYQADEECLNSGITVQNYQGLLLNQVFRVKLFSAANSFSNPTLIKKRMIMMTKKRSKALANLKIILVLPVLILLLFTFSTCVKKSFDSFTGTGGPTPTETLVPPDIKVTNPTAPLKDGEAFVVVEEMPKFPGGDTALLRYIAMNTKYPQQAKENNIQGRVIIRFKVMEDGSVADATVLKSVDPGLDSEAIRVVNSIPKFEPGKVGGVPVPVWYMIPITFTLAGKSNATQAPPPPPPPAGNSKEKTAPFVVVEEMPQFPGGDSALLNYIARNVKYPEAAKTNKITGKVVVRFCVTETGGVDMIDVMRGVDPELNAESIRVVKTLPLFKPGKQGGVPVPVWYMVPITFALK